jgi:hypothetical protein
LQKYEIAGKEHIRLNIICKTQERESMSHARHLFVTQLIKEAGK